MTYPHESGATTWNEFMKQIAGIDTFSNYLSATQKENVEQFVRKHANRHAASIPTNTVNSERVNLFCPDSVNSANLCPIPAPYRVGISCLIKDGISRKQKRESTGVRPTQTYR